MKLLIVSYLGIYLLVTFLASVYSYTQSKKMTKLRFFFTLFVLMALAVTSYFYANAYQDWQLLVFATGFTLISSLFLYNGTKDTSEFSKVMFFSIGRFLLHVQFLILLYVVR